MIKRGYIIVKQKAGPYVRGYGTGYGRNYEQRG